MENIDRVNLHISPLTKYDIKRFCISTHRINLASEKVVHNEQKDINIKVMIYPTQIEKVDFNNIIKIIEIKSRFTNGKQTVKGTITLFNNFFS